MAAPAPINSATHVDLAYLPLIYVLNSQIDAQEIRSAEEALISNDAHLTYDIHEAGIILTNVSTTRRVQLELKWKGLDIGSDVQFDRRSDSRGRQIKRPKISGPSRASLNDSLVEHDCVRTRSTSSPARSAASSNEEVPVEGCQLNDIQIPSDHVLVAKLAWLADSLKSGVLLPLPPFVLLRGKKKRITGSGSCDRFVGPGQSHAASAHRGGAIPNLHSLPSRTQTSIGPGHHKFQLKRKDFARNSHVREALRRDFDGRSFSSSTQNAAPKPTQVRATGPTPLIHRTTSEDDATDTVVLPKLPEWVAKKQFYSCERATPAQQPNYDFIAKLDQIRLARLLTSDEIGVRAYSTSIAAIAAYPYSIRSSKEILTLPGCDQKIAHLFHEFQTNDGKIAAVTELEADQVLSTLREFYDIWGVGAVTARNLHYDRGFQDLDDVIEFGWDSLSRVQQIGLKYYDEFKLKISRSECELISNKILHHARQATDPDVQAIIVGGYRRGKTESGDVDVILSHPDVDLTLNLVSQVVASLEKEGCVTHTLTLNLTNTKRKQEPLQMKPSGGSGFDTLDKALVVWQDPEWRTKESDLAANPKAKNPNPHRRVDIIISPWKTIGCAVAGWSSGTTFQRDLRRYAKKVKGWKFDSSGVRDRVTGDWIDLEGWRDEATRSQDWKQSEIRVFEGLGLMYREPEERCTW